MSLINESDIWLDGKSYHRTLASSVWYKPKYKLCYEIKKLKEQTLISLFWDYFYHFIVLKWEDIMPVKWWYYCSNTDIENVIITPSKIYWLADFRFNDIFKIEFELDLNSKIASNDYKFAYNLKKDKYEDLNNHMIINEEAEKCYCDFKNHEVKSFFTCLDYWFDVSYYE
jgi:hypothetical protein